jgi:hypothetical protein
MSLSTPNNDNLASPFFVPTGLSVTIYVLVTHDDSIKKPTDKVKNLIFFIYLFFAKIVI